MNESAPSVAQINYAGPGLARRPPFAWGAALRQITFSIGVGVLASGLCWAFMRDANNDPTPVLVGIGAGLVCATLPWPGRIGRRREPS